MQNNYNCAHRCIIPALTKIIRGLDIKSGSGILDAGCGSGVLINTLYGTGFTNVWGFDISDAAVNSAKNNFSNIAQRVFKHNAYKPRLPDAMPRDYGLIISMEVIEHLYNPKAYLKNLYNWLDKNGYLIITTPYHGYLKNLLISVANKFERHFNPLSEGGHIKFFSRGLASLLLEEEGFETTLFKGVGRAAYIWKSMILVARKRQ